MGGGTCDLSVMHINAGTLTVQATGGNNVLGGKNIDAALLKLVLKKAESLTGECSALHICVFYCFLLLCGVGLCLRA